MYLTEIIHSFFMYLILIVTIPIWKFYNVSIEINVITVCIHS